MKQTTATTPDKTGAACMHNHNNEQPSDYTTCKDINIPKNADSKTTANRSGLESPKRPQTTVTPATSTRSTKLRNTLDPTSQEHYQVSRWKTATWLQTRNKKRNAGKPTLWSSSSVNSFEHVPVPEKRDTPLPEDLAATRTVIDLSVNKNGDILKRLARGRSTGPGDFPTEVMQTGG